MRPPARVLATAMILCLAVSSAHAASCPTSDLYAAPTSVALAYGSFPVSIATGDLDADGHLDVAVTLLQSDQVAVLLGRGDGTFEPAVTYPAGPLPRGIVAADFDGDGALDLAVSDVGDSVVSVLLGQRLGGLPTGSFAPAVAYRAGAENRGMVAFDWSGDGYLDLVVAGRTSIALLSQLTPGGQGTGAFERTAVHPTPGSWSVAAGRWGPGQPWYVGANWTASSLTVVGDASIPMPAGSAEITSGDLDGDARADLVVPGQNGIRVLLAHPTLPQFGIPVSLITDTHLYNDALILDANLDGHADIAATDADAQELVILLGAGDGTFPVVTRLGAWSGPNGIAAGDLDADGRDDLMVVNSGTSVAPAALFVYRGRCGLSPAPVLTDVRDVPHDQGGRVSVTWTRSGLDNRSERAIATYRVWRRIHRPGVAARPATGFAAFMPGVHTLVARPSDAAIEYWEPVAEIPAAFLEGYGFTAPTTQDSIAGSNPYTAFFVQALTSDPFTFYASAVDSGYSVDDLAPPAPTPFVAVYSATGAALHWGPSTAPDFARFRLHRGSQPGFVPDDSNLIASQPDTGFVDSTGAGEHYYKLAAVDLHGNVGRFALVSPDGSVATAATCVASETRDGRVRLTWYVSGDEPAQVTVYRRTSSSEWRSLGPVTPDGAGFVRFEDAEVEAGARYGYRLGFATASAPEWFAGEAWVAMPVDPLALAPRVPSPVRGGDVTVTFAFPAGRSTRVELIDVGGRVVAAREVGDAGRQSITLAAARALAPGLYFVRVGLERPLIARVVVVR